MTVFFIVRLSLVFSRLAPPSVPSVASAVAGTKESTIASVRTRAKNFFFMGLLLFILPFAFESPIVVGVKPTTKGYTLLFFCNIAIAAIRLPEHVSSLAVSYVIIVPHGRRSVQAFAGRRSGIFCVTSRLSPLSYLSFQQKCPCVGFLFGSRTGAGGLGFLQGQAGQVPPQ